MDNNTTLISSITTFLFVVITCIIIQGAPSSLALESTDGGGGEEPTSISIDETTLTVLKDVSAESITLDDDTWSSIKTIIVLSGVNKIAPGSFSKCVNVEEISGKYDLKDQIIASLVDSGYPKTLIRLTDDEDYLHLYLGSEASTTNTLTDCEKLKSVVICSDATSLGSAMLSSLKESTCLESVIIDCPNLKSIGNNSFKDLTSLKTVEIRGSVSSIGNDAFSGCTSLIEVIIPTSLINFGISCFEDDVSLLSVHPQGSDSGVILSDNSGITDLGQYLFSGCSSINNVSLPSSLKNIGNYTFKNCEKLKNIDLNDCNLEYFSLNENSFEGCKSLETTIIVGTFLLFMGKTDGICNVPSGVQTICRSAFWERTEITDLYLTDEVSKINCRASNPTFAHCSKLTNIHNYHSGIQFDSSPFIGAPVEPIIVDNILYYSGSTSETYVVPSNIKSIEAGAFYGNTHLKTVIFKTGNDITLGKGIFEKCTNLQTVTFENGIPFISNNMFKECTSLRNIDLSGVTYIYREAFYGAGLESVTIPSSVLNIESGAFRNCTHLNTAIFQGTVVSFNSPDGGNNNATSSMIFGDCTSLSTVTLPNNLTMIPMSMFQGCTKLTTIALPQGLEFISDSAFSDSGLTRITLPEGISSIGANAFLNCLDLTVINLPSSLIGDGTIGDYAFRNIGLNTENGTNVSVDGCITLPRYGFIDSKINNLILDSAPFLTATREDDAPFYNATVANIVVSGGVGFKYNNVVGSLLQLSLDDNKCIPVKMKVGNSLINGSMLCVSTGDVLTIGKDVVSISANILENSSFKSIVIDPENKYFTSLNGALYFESNNSDPSTLENAKLVYVDKSTFDSKTHYTVYDGTVSIAPYAFSGNTETIQSILIPDSVQKLESYSVLNVNNIAVDSSIDLPLFNIGCTSNAKIFFRTSMSDEIIDSFNASLTSGEATQVSYGGYYIDVNGNVLLLQLPKSSANISASTDEGTDSVRVSVNVVPSYDNSIISITDGDGKNYSLQDGSITIPSFVGSKVLYFEGLVINTYAVTLPSDDAAFSISTSVINTDKITHGTVLNISITPNNGYDGTSMTVKYGEQTLNPSSDGKGRFVCTVTVISNGELTVDGIVPKETHNVIFCKDNGEEDVVVSVVSGYAVESPSEPEKKGFVFFGWFSEDSSLFEFSKSVVSDIKLTAWWVDSDTEMIDVNVSVDNGSVSIFNVNRDCVIDNNTSVIKGTTLIITFKPISGYEPRSWTVNGEKTSTISKTANIIADSNLNIKVESEYTVSAYPYLETDIQTPNNIKYTGLYWKVKGTEGFNEMVYTPSILGDYVYSWSGKEIFKIDLMTGEIVKRVDTGVETVPPYYNMTTVGNGYILAGYAGQVYDKDLNPVFRLYLDEKTVSSELKTYYNDGYFFVFTEENVYKFLAIDKDAGNNIQYPEKSSSTKYTHYISWYQGQSNLIFTDRFIIGIEYDDKDRYLVTYDLDTLQYIDSFLFEEIQSANLNTGYISYYNGTVYFNTYHPDSSMFNTAAGPWNSISSIELDSEGHFVPITVHYYDLGTTSYPSSLIVVGDYGYINCGNTFYVFDMKTMEISNIASSKMSHGNMAVSVQGDNVYAYVVPYESTNTFMLFNHNQTKNELTVNQIGRIDKGDSQFSSQIVHFGPHGELIYYNDSGYLFCIGFQYDVTTVYPKKTFISQFTPNGNLPKAKTTATPPGTTFVGWYDNEAFTGEKLTKCPGVYHNITLYAKFVPYKLSGTTLTISGDLSADDIYLDDAAKDKITKIVITGTVTTVDSSVLAMFKNVTSIDTKAVQINGITLKITGDLSADDIYLDDAAKDKITKIVITGTVTTVDSSVLAMFKNVTSIDTKAVQINGITLMITGDLSADDIYLDDAAKDKITKIVITGTVTTVDSSVLAMFKKATSLEFFDVDTICSFGKTIFDNCSSIDTVILSDSSVTSVGENIFSGCSTIKKIILPSSVNTIGDRAFVDCTRLEVVCIGENILFLEDGMHDGIIIGKDAFKGCTSYSAMDQTIIKGVSIDGFVNGGQKAILSLDTGSMSPEKVLLITYSALVELDGMTVLNPFMTDYLELDDSTNNVIYQPKEADVLQSISVTCWYKVNSVPYTTAYTNSIVPPVSSVIDMEIESDAILYFDGVAVTEDQLLEYGYYTISVSGVEGVAYAVNGDPINSEYKLFYYGQKLKVTRSSS